MVRTYSGRATCREVKRTDPVHRERGRRTRAADWASGAAGAGPRTAFAKGTRVRLEGQNGQITVEGDQLTISREGLTARTAFGKLPERRIPLQAVSGSDLHPATRLLNGWLTLGLQGRPVPALTATTASTNGDTVMFTRKQQDDFQRFHEWLQTVAATNAASGIDPAAVHIEGPASKQENKQAEAEAAGMRPDIAAAMSRMTWKLGGGREIKKLPEHLHEGERVEYIAQGKYGDNQGIVVMTDSRLLFVFHGFTRQVVEDFPYRSISSVQNKAGMLLGELKVFASGNQAVISELQKPDLKYLVDALRQRLGATPAAATPAPAAAPAPPAAPDVMDQLRRLGELRDAGVLTQQEFDAKKAELLARL
jgi:hypothetical protein